MQDSDPRIAESRRGVFLPLPPGVIDRVQRAEFRRIVVRTRYFLARAFAAVLCTVSMDWGRLDPFGWYLYDFNTENVFPAVARRTKQWRMCARLEPCTRVVPLKLEEQDRAVPVPEKVKRETDYAVAKEHWIRSRAAKVRRKVVRRRSTNEVPVALETVAARSGQRLLSLSLKTAWPSL